MKCPKCTGEVETIQYDGQYLIHRCKSCQGLLMDDEVLSLMLHTPESEDYLDTGSEEKGKLFDRIEDINCPQCSVPMDKMWDPVQTHIWKECCPHCGLTFLDAGEFTDLKYRTVSDMFKNLFKGTRKS